MDDRSKEMRVPEAEKVSNFFSASTQDTKSGSEPTSPSSNDSTLLCIELPAGCTPLSATGRFTTRVTQNAALLPVQCDARKVDSDLAPASIALGVTSLSVNDKTPPADCDSDFRKCDEICTGNNVRRSSVSANSVVSSFDKSSQPKDSCDPPGWGGSIDIISLVEQEVHIEDVDYDLKGGNSSNSKSALFNPLNFAKSPHTVVKVYTLPIIEWVSEQNLVRNLGTLPPELREEELMRRAHGNSVSASRLSEPPPGVSEEKSVHQLISTLKPGHPEYAVETRRMESFNAWPLLALHSPKYLAKAGFYYTGFGDCVRCFFCDGGLQNWKIMDNPWEEHARWFKECKYLLDVKGQAYVDEIQAKHIVGIEAPRLVETPRAATNSTSPDFWLEHPSVQLVKSLGYSESQILAALECLYPQHQTGMMPKGAELLDAVLLMEDEASGTARPAPSETGRSLPASGRVQVSIEAATPFAVAASRPSETTNAPAQCLRQLPQADKINGPDVAMHSSRTVPDVRRQPEFPSSELPLASLHDIIFAGLFDVRDAEARYVEETRQWHNHLGCKCCRQRPAEVVLQPCGHYSTCLECVPSLRNCPVCATVVRGTIRWYHC